MSRHAPRVDDLLVSSNFIRAVRESGYLSISTALAELVDNSMQASATEVAISISRDGADALHEIVVEDNGCGMSKAELELCLRFGGSSRFDSRQSFGRFGMGLPAASLSQARRIEVTAWRNSGYERTVALDVDAIAAGSDQALLAHRGPLSATASGCRVRWMQCDRIEYRRLIWLERSLHRELGRMYRRFIASGLRLTINGTPVEAVDPTLLTTDIEEHRRASPSTTSTTSWRPPTAARLSSLSAAPYSRSSAGTTSTMSPSVGSASLAVGASRFCAPEEIASGWYLMGANARRTTTTGGGARSSSIPASMSTLASRSTSKVSGPRRRFARPSSRSWNPSPGCSTPGCVRRLRR